MPPAPLVEQPAAEQKVVEPKSQFKMLFIALAILGVFFTISTYLLIVLQKNGNGAAITNKTVETQTVMHQMDQDLKSIDTKSIDTEFTEVDQELKNL